MNRPKFYVYLPIIFALVLILGIVIGRSLNSNGSDGIISLKGNNEYSKVEEILKYIEQEYVDTIKGNKLIDNTIISMLSNLDPHSSYITAEELKASNEPLQGNFEGVGIEFNLVDDTIRVVAVIPGGPAESVGMQAGDKIVKVNGENVAGIKISNKGVMDKLKGVGGTKVKVGVMRKSKTQLQDFTITRGTIPLYSIDVAMMLTSQTGYIKISRFAATTFTEYKDAFEKLKTQGLKSLIIDLRGNGGGFLNTAVDLADEFLMKDEEIVYTEGKSRPRANYKATSKGEFETGKLIVLIDDGSASASEILAGALQDNDRATIVGRRSFGKGLVQEQSEFSDGSAIRLTIARYYTPCGRCIQKPYDKGLEAYYSEEYDRYENGELQTLDSIKLSDSLKFRTVGGRIVYSGGGIVPDVFVPIDTTGRSKYLAEVVYNGYVNDFAFEYADKQRTILKNYKTADAFNKSFVITDAILNQFVAYADKKGIKRNDIQLTTSKGILKNQLKALISRNIFSSAGYYSVFLATDNVIKKSLELVK